MQLSIIVLHRDNNLAVYFLQTMYPAMALDNSSEVVSIQSLLELCSF